MPGDKLVATFSKLPWPASRPKNGIAGNERTLFVELNPPGTTAVGSLNFGGLGKRAQN
jgi:hypothetical protein